MELQEGQNDESSSFQTDLLTPEISQESARGESISPIGVQNIKILCAFLLLLPYKYIV